MVSWPGDLASQRLLDTRHLMTSSPRTPGHSGWCLRSFFIRFVALGAVALMLGSLLAIAQPRPERAGAAVTMRLTAAENAHLTRLNDWRQARGLSRLQIDPVTQLYARDWTLAMAGSRTLAHDPNAGDDCRAASSSCSRWAENVGYSSQGESKVFSMFEASSGHNANMRRTNVDRVGIGVFTDSSGTTWVTQRFIACGCTNDGATNAANAERSRFEGFVAALYADFLGRNGSGGEIAGHVDRLVYRGSVAGTIAAFSESNEWLGRLIDGYYQSTLGRPADPAGKQTWMRQYRNGWTPARIAAAFYASSEFYQRSGNTNRKWITAMYQQILHRNPDSKGLDDWTRKADSGMSRTDIAYTFFQSLESRSTRVNGLYQHLLGRNADSTGMSTWTKRLADGRDVRLAATLARSAEYISRADRRF